MAHSYRESLYSRPSNNGGPNTTRRIWSNNGIQVSIESSSYSSPGASFGVFNASSQTSPRIGGGMIGAAFNLLNLLGQQPQSSGRDRLRRASRQSNVEDMAYGDFPDDFGQDKSRGQPRGSFSNLAEDFAHNSQRPQRTSQNRERSPIRKDSRPPKSRNQTEQREPPKTRGRTAAYVEDTSDDEDSFDEDEYEYYSVPRDEPPRRTSTANDTPVIHALAEAAEHHRQQVRNCQKRLEQVSKHRTANSNILQGLVNELKGHEKAYEKAVRDLERAKGNGGKGSSTRQAPRPSKQNSSFFDDFEPFTGTARSHHPVFPTFNDFSAFGAFPSSGHGRAQFGFDTSFDRFFNEFGNPGAFHSQVFGMPQAAFTFSSGPRVRSTFSTGNARPQFQQVPQFTPFPTQAPNPPPNLLKPGEAKALFQKYNDRWNALAPTDPNIPYPARGMKPAGLCVRDTIWAPLVPSPVSTWSEETIMRANAQAFFLGVVGLTPSYTEASGTVKMTYDSSGANSEKLKQLVDILKKERNRWHSDRLGRRNGGGAAGTNEALQRDERARAVFHAVCDLMEVIQ